MNKSQIEKLKARKGPARMADIPKDVLKALNAGVIETKTLVEWLAIDHCQLLKSALSAAKLDHHKELLMAAARTRI